MSDNSSIGVGFLKGLEPFGEFDEQLLNGLLPLLNWRFGRAAEALDVGEWQRRLVYLVHGELKLDFSDGSTLVMVGGSDEACRPLGKWAPLPCAAKAITDVDLLFLDEDKRDALVILNQLTQAGFGPQASSPEQGAAGKAVDERGLAASVATRMASQTFSALPPAEIEELLRHFQRITVRQGQTVVREDEAGDYYYLIEAGRCVVTRKVTGSPISLAELRAGDAFGEEALINQANRNATVVMQSDGVLWRLGKQDFDGLLRERLIQPISHAEARQRVAAGAVWLDVRFNAEYQYDGLAGARNIPLGNIRTAWKLLDSAGEYIVYCQNGRRSAAAAFLLAQRGFRVSVLEGGLCGDDNNMRGARS